MNKKILAMIMVVMVALLCVPATATAATNTYPGPWPTFPNAVGKKAIELSWPLGTSSAKYKYPKGGGTAEFNKAIAAVYPERSKWSAQCRAGASCDVGSGTAIRASGYDTAVPRALAKQFPYFASSSKWSRVSNPTSSNVKAGDVILWDVTGPGAHICIVVEKGNKKYIAESSYSRAYCIHLANNLSSQLKSSSSKKVFVYRAKNTCRDAFSKGDNSSEVKKLQDFLNWAGFNCGTADGIFGSTTEKAVVEFQEATGLEADGEFGSKSLAVAKTYVSGSQTAVVQKKAYSGKLPTKTISQKKGTKANIIYWQKYLKWYGYNIKVDGSFGKQTVKYSKLFQSKNKLKTDGVIGKLTINKAKTITK